MGSRVKAALKATAWALLLLQPGALLAQGLSVPVLQKYEAPVFDPSAPRPDLQAATSDVTGAARNASATKAGVAGAVGSRTGAGIRQTGTAVRAVKGSGATQAAATARRGARSARAVRRLRLSRLTKLFKAFGAAAGGKGAGVGQKINTVAPKPGNVPAVKPVAKPGVTSMAKPGAVSGATPIAKPGVPTAAKPGAPGSPPGSVATKPAPATNPAQAPKPGDPLKKPDPKPKSATASKLQQVAQQKLKLSNTEVTKLRGYVESSPLKAQLKMPFAPSNILLAVGATAGMTAFSQMGSEEGMDMGKTLSFLGDKNFWGGLIGSGVGYSLASVVAMSLIPGGAGLIPMVTPLFAGMAGSILGWEFGSGLLGEGGLRGALENLSPTRILGQAAGTTAGLLIGANLGAMVGGTLGAVAGPAGAIMGALVMGNMGAKITEAIKGAFTGDTEGLDRTLGEAGTLLDRIQEVGDAVSEIVPASLPSANLGNDGLSAKLVAEYESTYVELREALVANNRALAYSKLKYLQGLQARYQQAVGGSLQKLAEARRAGQ